MTGQDQVVAVELKRVRAAEIGFLLCRMKHVKPYCADIVIFTSSDGLEHQMQLVAPIVSISAISILLRGRTRRNVTTGESKALYLG